MNKEYAILLVDSASFYAENHGLKSHFIASEKHDANVEKHDANIEKHNADVGKHIVKECIYNDRKIAENYFLNRFCNGEIFFGYISKKNIRKLKIDFGISVKPMQEVLEEIKTQGYMYTYILPIFDKKTPEYSEMQEEIDTRVSYGCFTDIIVAEAIDQDNIKDNLLQILAQQLEEVIK